MESEEIGQISEKVKEKSKVRERWGRAGGKRGTKRKQEKKDGGQKIGIAWIGGKKRQHAQPNYSCLAPCLLQSRNFADFLTPCSFSAPPHGALSLHAPMFRRADMLAFSAGTPTRKRFPHSTRTCSKCTNTLFTNPQTSPRKASRFGMRLWTRACPILNRSFSLI